MTPKHNYDYVSIKFLYTKLNGETTPYCFPKVTELNKTKISNG